MSTAPGTIPYEKQADPQTSRMCGAACLSMVYRSFGKEVSQTEIWPAIAKVNRSGSLASTTHLMAQDALGRGLAAVAFQARHPIQALRLCREFGVRAILNHRKEMQSPSGHYSVMVDLDAKNVFLHDPYLGPSRSLSHAELLDLWQPKFPNSEIVGGVLIAIAEAPPDMPPCQFCRTPTPPSMECPNCRKPVGLKPAAVMGCMNQNCIARMWNYICCPACDFMWNLDSRLEPVTAGVTGAGAPGSTPFAPFREPATLNPAFEAVDRLVDHIRSIPGALDNPDVRKQLDILNSGKADLKLALAEAAIHVNAYQGQVGGFVQAAEERRQAHKQKMTEANKQAEPLDGAALGRALLKNLGFTD